MIEKECGSFCLICDECGFEETETFDTFYDAVNFKKEPNSGWVSKRIDGDWMDLCSDCADEY
jgi:hypothetical protein